MSTPTTNTAALAGPENGPAATLTTRAATQLAAATAALAAIGLTPHQLRALVFASEIAEALDDAEDYPFEASVDAWVESNGDNAQDVWFGDVRDAREYLREADQEDVL